MKTCVQKKDEPPPDPAYSRIWIHIAQEGLSRCPCSSLQLASCNHRKFHILACAFGTKFPVEYALSCSKGSFLSNRHNEIRDMTANQFIQICNYVCITGEALTSSFSNAQDGARLDIAINRFWSGQLERTSFDVRVFNPCAPNRTATERMNLRRSENANSMRGKSNMPLLLF